MRSDAHEMRQAPRPIPLAFPGRCAARSDALQSRGPVGDICGSRLYGAGTPHRVRDTSIERIYWLNVMIAPDEAEAGLDLGNLGPADRDAMRNRTVELDDGAIALLADKADMRNGHDMTAVHPDE
jgi:hypothetical protein